MSDLIWDRNLAHYNEWDPLIKVNPIQLFVQQQAYFQELQAKQQNEFQKMMMKIMQSTRKIHE